MVFRLVLTTFCSWFPFAIAPQTSTIAVQGLALRRMTAKNNWSWSVRKTFANTNPTAGATIQFEKNVINIGVGVCFSFFSSEPFKFKTAGYIMKNRQIPIGTEIPRMEKLTILSAALVYLESRTPTSMQSGIHITKYFSKPPNPTFSFASVIRSYAVVFFCFVGYSSVQANEVMAKAGILSRVGV